MSWALLTGPGLPPRKTNRVTRVVRLPDVHLDSYDELVSYDSDGQLKSVRKIRDISAAERKEPYVLAPDLRPLSELTERYPREGYRKLLAANECLKWGLWNEAKRYLDGAAASGAGQEASYRQLKATLAEGLREEAKAARWESLLWRRDRSA